MALGGKTLQDLLAPISEQQGRKAPATSIYKPEEWSPTPVRATDGLSRDELVSMFAEEAKKVRVDVHRCSAEELASCVAGIVAEGEGGSVVVADDDRLSAAGVAEALRGVAGVTDVLVWDAEKGRENVEAARVALYGVTYASAGIAETATVAQPTNARCGRSISLLPLHHIAVVDAKSIVGTMGDVLKRLKKGALPSQMCFISGPSATADIELVRVEGVHGPMYVHYVIVG